MKKTQMIHSPSTFKLGLGLMLAASIAAMPVLIGAGDKRDAAKAKEKAAATEVSANKKLKAAGKIASLDETDTPSAESIKRRLASAKKPAKKVRSMSAEERARERIAKVEAEAKKLAARLTPTQKTKLLALLNDAKAVKLTEIEGIGKSRSSAIEKARPIKSVEDLQRVKGVGLKTLAEVVDHGRSLTRSRSSSSKAKAGAKKSGSHSQSSSKKKAKA